MISAIRKEKDSLTAKYADLKTLADGTELPLQHIYANYFVIKVSGFVENSFINILEEYARIHSNESIKRLVRYDASRLNSINCEKMESFLNRLDSKFWKDIKARSSDADLSAVDSLKALRDEIVHGKNNGTGLITLKTYFQSSCKILENIHSVMLT